MSYGVNLMKISGARLLLEMLRLHGVKDIFGLPGETTLGFYREWEKFPGIRHILTHDERAAAFMAEAYAKAAGVVGVSEAPSPGALHPLPGILESNAGSVPTIILTSDVPYNYDKKNMLTGFDQNAVYRSVTKESILVTHAADIPHLIRRAFRIALADKPGAVHIRIPMDVYIEDVEAEDVYADESMSRWPQDRPVADPSRINEAIELMFSAKRPVIICGQGALVSGAGEEIVSLSEVLNAPVGCTMTGKGTIAETHPMSLRLIGARGGTSFSNRFLKDADFVLFVGTNTDSAGTDAWKLPSKMHQPVAVQLDISRVETGNNYDTKVNLVGDAKATLALMLEKINRNPRVGNSTYSAELVTCAMNELERSIAEAAVSETFPVHPIRFVRTLSRFLPEKSLIVTEASTASIFAAAYMTQPRSGRWFISNYSMGALGYVIPAAVGAAVAKPDHTIIGMGGDGSFHFNCGELETWARYGLDIKYIVFNNDTFGWIRGEIAHVYGSNPFATDFGRTDYCKVAEGFGVKSFRISSATKIDEVLKEAFVERGPCLIELHTKPEDEECPPVPRWIPNAVKKGISYHY
jgi:acetolactate synthase-1/2/3 large subunit